MAEIIAGRALANSVIASLKERLASHKISLSVVCVGDNPASLKFIQEKERACRETGIDFELVALPADVSQEEAERAVRLLAENPRVSGIVVQLPLSKTLDTQAIMSLIPLNKDPDVLCPAAFERFALGRHGLLPPTVGAIGHIIESRSVSLVQKDALVVGMGRLVGLPLSLWLLGQGARVSVATSATQDLADLCLKADIVVSGVGKPRTITGEMVKRGAFVIDAGTSVEDGQSVGDVDTESVVDRAGVLAPVPGGVGPLTVAFLLSNLVSLSTQDQRK